MALHTLFRKSSSSLIPVATRSIENGRLLQELSSSVPSLRFCTGKASSKKNRRSSDKNLTRIIDSEINFALESDIHDCVVEISDGFPFEIKDNPGQRSIELKRSYQDEIIKVEAFFPNVGNEDIDAAAAVAVNNDNIDDDVTNKAESSILLLVNVLKSRLCLKFGVRASPNEISVHSLSIKEQESTENKQAYKGPEFSDLDENLQKAFHVYLETRGLNPSTANFLLEYMISKDSKEYLQWLKNLKKFVEY